MNQAELFRHLQSLSHPDQLWTLLRRQTSDCTLAPSALAGLGACVLYGAGFFAREVLQQWQQAGYQPQGLVDSNPAKWGGELEGMTIQSPAVLAQLPAGTAVVIAAMQVHGLGEPLQELGLDVWYAERDGSIGRTPGHWLLRHPERVDKLWSSLQENHSRQVLLYTMAARLFQQFHFPMQGNIFLNPLASSPQYFDHRVWQPRGRQVYVDCGAFDGDSIVAFVRALGDEHQIIAYEGDRQNYLNAQANLQRYQIAAQMRHCIVGGQHDTGLSYNCRDLPGEQAVERITLDQDLFARAIHPTLIKMDIEGSELAALEGSRQIIQQVRPRLAICSYHTTRDLIEVPMFIIEHGENYRLILRHHSPNTLWETVAYGEPLPA
ncbi:MULTISPECIES: FkbM family methyltransferase [Aquitalea]|uniref:FkbM family methyltransferase n=1 Tax=Aquitalea TaxID=407217 RepID=UPI001315477D|nr:MULTISPECIES: FkbM family methyltransferase [Aquitalea]